MSTQTDSRRASVWSDLQDIAERAGSRTLTAAEVNQFDALEAEYATLGTGDVATRGAALARVNDEIAMSNAGRVRGATGTERSPGDIITLKPEERMSSLVTNDEARGLTMSRYVRAIVLGDWNGIAPEARAMSVGSGAGGGFVVPDQLSARVIDRARNAARVLQAGATTVPMAGATLKLARVAATGGDPVPGWKLENASAPASDLVLEQISLTAKTLVCLVKSSIELIEDSEEIEDVIEGALASALAVQLDYAALRGSGVNPEPKGVRNTAGVTIQSMGVNGASLTSYDALSTAIQTVQGYNGSPTAVIYSPRTAGSLDRLKDTTNQPLRPPPSVEGIQKLVTAQIGDAYTQGTSSLASEIFVGEWPELLIGVRRNLVIEASREAADTTESAFRNLGVWIRGYLRADIAVAQPSHFTVITGVL